MNRTIVSALIAVAAVLLLGALARRAAPPIDAAPRPPEPDDVPLADVVEDDDDEDAGEPEEAADEAVAVTSDGFSFLAAAHSVRLVPPARPAEPWQEKHTIGGASERGAAAIAMTMHAGDYRGGRVVRGSAGIDPWRLELLGRDGEYASWAFETREASAAALALLESKRVVQLGRDEDGNPAPPSAEAFEEARRIYEETEQALAMDDDGDDEGGVRG